jgi:hypothetical protein
MIELDHALLNQFLQRFDPQRRVPRRQGILNVADGGDQPARWLRSTCLA